MKPKRSGGWSGDRCLVPSLSLSWLFASVLTAAICLGLSPNASASLTIHNHFDLTNPPPDPAHFVGGGNLEDIVNAAEASWERAFVDKSDPWNLDLTFSWANLGTDLGVCKLGTEGGSPNRIESAQIELNNSGAYTFFADPTPLDNSEYAKYTNITADLGGGPINIGRVFSGATGAAAGKYDLLQLATHEIGHAVGMLNDSKNWAAQIPNGQTLEITAPRPDAGTTIFMFAGHIDQTHYTGPLMVNFANPGERRLISGVDVLAEAQFSSFAHPNLNPDSIGAPEPPSGALALLPMGLVGSVGLVIRRRRGPACRYL
jgi:hypothetical protein